MNIDIYCQYCLYQNITKYGHICVIINLAEDAACPPGSQHAYQGPVLKVSAFNIQIFGKSKFKKEEVVSTLVQVSQCLQLFPQHCVHTPSYSV